MHPSKLLLILLLIAQPLSADWLREEADIMGTRVTVELFHRDRDIAQKAADAVLEEMRRIDSSMSPYIESSELAQLNANAQNGAFRVSEEFFSLLRRSVWFSDITGGAFDVTFASAGFLYDYRSGERPANDQLQQVAALINYRNLVLDIDERSVAFAKPGVRVDLGGIAKGYAVDRCIALLQTMDIEHALVTAGGDSRMIGDRWGRPWKIGVRDPRRKNGLIAVIPLLDVAVSTSGDYQRYFEEDGVRYHHIINPKSGDSARELRSVTVIGPDATTTDALSTSVFVLGVEAGLALVNKMPGIDAILVDKRGRLHYSDSLQSAKIMDNSVKHTAQAVAH